MRKSRHILLLAISLGVLLELTGCGLLGNKRFHYLFENEDTVVSLSKENEVNPLKMYLEYTFPESYAFPRDTSGLELKNTELRATLMDAEGNAVTETYTDSLNYWLYQRKMAGYATRNTMFGFNENGTVKHSVVFAPFGEMGSGWQVYHLHLALYPSAFEFAPIAGQRTRVTRVTGSQPIWERSLPFEMKL